MHSSGQLFANATGLLWLRQLFLQMVPVVDLIFVECVRTCAWKPLKHVSRLQKKSWQMKKREGAGLLIILSPVLFLFNRLRIWTARTKEFYVMVLSCTV